MLMRKCNPPPVRPGPRVKVNVNVNVFYTIHRQHIHLFISISGFSPGTYCNLVYFHCKSETRG